MGYLENRVFPAIFFFYFPMITANFCITISATALMLQVMFPWLSEREKRCLQSNAVTKCKLFLETTAVIMIVVYSISLITWVSPLNIIIFIIYRLQILLYYFFCLTSFIIQIFSIICLLLFGCKTVRLRTSTKILRIKLFLLAVIVVFDSIIFTASFIVITSGNHTSLSPVFISIADFVCIFVFVTIVTALTYPREVWCCCYRRPANLNVRTPLLINTTQEQQTNPVSVWDHRNDPSTTATVYQPEMTDCRSDYEQIL